MHPRGNIALCVMSAEQVCKSSRQELHGKVIAAVDDAFDKISLNRLYYSINQFLKINEFCTNTVSYGYLYLNLRITGICKTFSSW